MYTLRKLTTAVILTASLFLPACNGNSKREEVLTLALSPYQDLAMIVNIANLGLEKKYGVTVHLNTMAWEEIVPAVASAGHTVDIGFGSLVEYLTKQSTLNPEGEEDPVLFVYPAYVFKGGSFISFDQRTPALSGEGTKDPELIRDFLKLKIGAQKSSIYEMMIYSLARRADVDPRSLKLFDTPLNDGILATQSGSLDVSAAGLTQITEATKRGGRVVLTMGDMGFADITGFICKKSSLEKKRSQIEKLIKMWFDSVSYVLSDIDHNSATSLKYLDQNASTKYSLQQYKDALSQEFFPLTIDEADRSLISDGGQFSYRRISEDVGDYLVRVKKAVKPPTVPAMITVH